MAACGRRFHVGDIAEAASAIRSIGTVIHHARATMTHVYFHCSNPERFVRDRHGMDVEDLVEAHQRAANMVREFVGRLGPRDWRAWFLRVSDQSGEDIFLMPFAYMAQRSH
jgi:hypothetical protein